MRFEEIQKISNIFSVTDSAKLKQFYLEKKSRRTRIRYKNVQIRQAYELFANSKILSDAYYTFANLLYNSLNTRHTILDLGIGEAIMWKKVLFYIPDDAIKNLGIVGVDFSENGLVNAKKYLSYLPLNRLKLIKSNIKKTEFKQINKSYKVDHLVSCLALHHLKYRDKIKVLKQAIKNGINRITLIEVDYNLETIYDDRLRNYAGALLYRDVFDSIRAEIGSNDSAEILNSFYYEELLHIFNSTIRTLDERYLPLIEWKTVLESLRMKIDLIKRTYSGINNIYHIGIIDASRT